MKRLTSAFAIAAAAAMPATAGVKYWDNPGFKAYDVGDYVQDGLVLHYDGIRNVGANVEHSNDSLVWNNLASSGKYRLDWCSWIKNTSDNKYYITKKDGTNGKWGSNGFIFDGTECFAYTNETDGAFSFPPEYTLQFAMTADTADFENEDGTGGYLLRPGHGWQYDGVAIRQTDNVSNGKTITPENAVYSIDQTRFNNTTTRANFSNPNPRYATVLSDAAAIRIFETTEIPTASTGGNSYKAGNRTASSSNNWLSFGAQYDGSPKAERKATQGFNGTLHAIRYYNNSLTEEQLAWNRVIDQNRFFGESAPIPVTNVVVATSAEGVDGDQPCGAYALDDDGYTFTAPAQRTINGKRYVLSGYTLQTWTGSDWGAEEIHADKSSCAATDTSRIKIIWQYAPASNEGQLKTYGVDDYVQNGLLLHYDGIRNVGADVAHDPDAHQWKNLAPGYESRWPMDWCSYIENSADNYRYAHNNYTQGEWEDDGFAFNGKSYFAKWNDGDPFAITTNFTVQIAVTGAIADQLGDPAYLWTGQHGYHLGSVAVRKSDRSAAEGNANSAYYINQTVHPNARPNFYPAGAKPSYINVIVDYDDTNASYIFDGVARPAKGGYDAPAITGDSPATNQTWFSVGGFHNRTGTAANLQSFNGTVHSFRFYNRALTGEELAQNRKVDEFRFYGRYAEPNVIVQSTYSYLEGYDKCGGYEVDGSYTFAAPATVTAPNGITYACDGYTVERKVGTVDWALVGSYESCSYLYNTSAGTIRLTWKWKATRGLRTAGDYSLDDLSPAGLSLHYDGLLNQGVGVDRSTTSTKWINLGSRPGMDLARDAASGDTSAWGEKGYVFAGQARFQSATVSWPTNFSAQVLVDAKHADNSNSKGHYIAATTWNRFGMQIQGSRSRARFYMQRVDADTASEVTFATSGGIDYMTAIHDAATKTAKVFPGTKAPTSGTGYKSFDPFQGLIDSPFRLGGWGGGNTDGQNLVGTVYNFRYYDRVLTEEELERNRNVDAVRYFSKLGVTNVLVAVEEGSGITAVPEPGAYFVEGQYTFTATGPAGLGYKVFEPDGNGGWRALDAIGQADSFAYDKSAADRPPAFVKLEWRLQKPFTLIVR